MDCFGSASIFERIYSCSDLFISLERRRPNPPLERDLHTSNQLIKGLCLGPLFQRKFLLILSSSLCICEGRRKHCMMCKGLAAKLALISVHLAACDRLFAVHFVSCVLLADVMSLKVEFVTLLEMTGHPRYFPRLVV